MSMEDVQKEQREWQLKNFPNSGLYHAYLGMLEEFGEFCHAQLKNMQGIRGTSDEMVAKEKDAIGDFWIYSVHFMSSVGVSITDVLAGTDKFAPYEDSDRKYPAVGIQFELGRLAEWFLFNRHSSNPVRTLTRLWVAFDKYCIQRSWQLTEVVESTWKEVSERDWIENPETGKADS